MRNGTRASRRRLRADAGAATVEFALIAPLFFMLVAGVLTFGRALHTQLELSTGAQEGARVLFTGGTDAQARDAVVAAAAVTPALTTGDVAVSTSSCAALASGSQVSVVASRVVNINWIVAAMDITVSGRGVVRCP